MTSRERLLAALSHQEVDYVPCSFMIFRSLFERSRDDLDFIRQQLRLGLDPVVELTMFGTGRGPDNPDLPGPPLHFHQDTKVTEWVEESQAGRVIYRRYDTPAGPLTTSVRWTEDWKAGPHVPLFDDWVIPRAHKFLVQTDKDLDALPYLLSPVNDAARRAVQETAAPKLALAREESLLVGAGWGVGLEAAAWLCGYDGMIWAAVDRPEWLNRLVQIIHEWNVTRMQAMMAPGIDLFLRRGWYEGADFLSPQHFRRFVLPYLHEEVRLAHQAGAKFAFINTSGTMPILDMLMEAGVDALVGVDPVQGKGTDLAQMRRKTRGRMALWGGVNGFVTVERGSAQEVAEAVELAMSALGPQGFILSPVDNVVDTSEQTRRNIETFLEAWRALR